MSDITTPMGVIVCPQCSLPKLTGVYGYAGPQCQCWHPTPSPTLDEARTLRQQSEEIRELRAELAASREREARLAAKLAYALRQNDLDMLLTGDEIRDCRAALAEGAQG